MDVLKELKAEMFHVELSLADIDALHKAGFLALDARLSMEDRHDLEGAMQKLDDTVNGGH